MISSLVMVAALSIGQCAGGVCYAPAQSALPITYYSTGAPLVYPQSFALPITVQQSYDVPLYAPQG